MAFERIGIRPAEILLPAPSVNPETWACIACDQYTSEPEYWQKAYETAGDAPSALRLILPEYDLKHGEERIPAIHAAMADYLAKGLLVPAVENGFVLCERSVPGGSRLGLVCTVDLEQYSFEKGSLPLIRPTEQTIASRLPPRLVIRRGAPVELTHIMILIDDPDRTVLEPLRAQEDSLRKLYDFDLMMNGGHLRGWAVEGEAGLGHVDSSLNALLDTLGENPLLLAVGDGNHSLATAKAYWNEIRETLPEADRENHPARYALCEIVNIHDTALLFEPIHRVLTGVKPVEVLAAWRDYAAARGMTLTSGGEGHTFTVVSAGGEAQVDNAMNRLLDALGADPLLLAVGDGNHSLATAKAYWNELREGLSEAERENHPARFALCEIVNIHDEALLFEPIHRVVTGTGAESLLADWQAYAAARGMTLDAAEGHAFTVVSADGDTAVTVGNPEGAIPCETVQKFLDDFLARHPGAEIDYIHGEQSLRTLASAPGAVGFLLPEIDKKSFFSDVKKLGVLPRKTFSMGEADEKRFYMEAKEI